MQAANDAMEECRSTGSLSPRLEAAQFYDGKSAEQARFRISSVASSPSSQYSSSPSSQYPSLPHIESPQRLPLGTETASERRPRDVKVEYEDYDVTQSGCGCSA